MWGRNINLPSILISRHFHHSNFVMNILQNLIGICPAGFVRILDFSFPGRFLVKYPNNVRGFFSRSFDLVYFLSRVRNVNICAVGKM